MHARVDSTKDKIFVMGVMKSPHRSQLSKGDEFYDTTKHRLDERPMTMPTTPKNKPFKLTNQDN